MEKIELKLELEDFLMSFTLENPLCEEYYDEIITYDEQFYGDLLDYYPELTLICDEMGRILYFHLETVGDNPLNFIKHFVEDFNTKKVPGVYTVPQLELKKVKFSKVLKTIVSVYQSYFENVLHEKKF